MMETADLEDAVRGLPTTRTCAGCDLCCTAIGVKELNKNPSERCAHLSGEPGRSCSIYADRPPSCRGFVCLWRGSDSALAQHFFPARCGFVISVSSFAFPMVVTIHPDPGRPKAWDTFFYRAEFLRLAAQLNAVVVVGQAHLACLVFAPSGRTYTREERPDLFMDGGRRVGLPADDFLPHRPSLLDTARVLWGKAVS